MKTLIAWVCIGMCGPGYSSLALGEGLTPCSLQIEARSVPGYVNSDGRCIPRPESRRQGVR